MKPVCNTCNLDSIAENRGRHWSLYNFTFSQCFVSFYGDMAKSIKLLKRKAAFQWTPHSYLVCHIIIIFFIISFSTSKCFWASLILHCYLVFACLFTDNAMWKTNNEMHWSLLYAAILWRMFSFQKKILYCRIEWVEYSWE